MYKYGPQINKKKAIDRFVKAKSRFFSNSYPYVLNHFGRLPHPFALSALFSSSARRMIGSFVYSIKIEINDLCNLKCKMCYVPYGEYKSISTKKVIEILKQVAGQGVRIELLGGEPLMHPGIIEIVNYAKKQAKSPFLSIYTNGTHMDEKMAALLKSANVDAVLVSLISHRKEIHNSFTGVEGSWEKTINGIRNSVKAGLSTYTFTAIHKDNFNDYRGIYNFAKEKLNAHAVFYHYIPQQENDPLLIDNRKWYKIKNSILNELSPDHTGFVRNFCMLTGNSCSGGNFVFTVKVDGQVQPCPFISDIPLGNIFKENIWEIFKNRFDGTGLHEFKSVPYECSPCVYKTICGGGCRAGNKFLDGAYSNKDIRCLGPYNKISEENKALNDMPTFF